ncbi:MAG: hypothetical protein JW803_02780 [Endomicrobiales bacterium]|nr:hypothetical protein [Endomicrobiales bacterium]
MNETVKKLYDRIDPCVLCPHKCGARRKNGQKGRCRTADEILVSSCNLHHGEEPPISGTRGSGTIFFANCTLSCVFCQNYPISQLGNGTRVNVEKLAGMMLSLQEQGAHNINLVTPSHVAAHIADAFYIAKRKGLQIPIVYNCGGYEDVETLKFLNGIVDIYMPDAKYSKDESALRYSGAQNYWDINKKALKEMFRQAGSLIIGPDGIAKKGLMIRHLVLPEDIPGSEEVLEFISGELSKDVYLSLMAQYHPAHRAYEFRELSRCVSSGEYNPVVKKAQELGLEKGWIQEL